jgi:Rieske Fe-S protein
MPSKILAAEGRGLDVTHAEAASNWTSSPSVGRRAVLSGLACGACLLMSSAATRAAGDAGDTKLSIQPGDRLALDAEGAPVALRPDDLKDNAPLMGVYPIDPASKALRKETRLNMLNLERLPGVAAGKDSAGVLAFSAICTHKGCSVTSWEGEKKHWRCLCHMSEFSATEGGEVMDGPAEVGLPILMLAIDAEGFLTVAAPFSSEPGAAA